MIEAEKALNAKNHKKQSRNYDRVIESINYYQRKRQKTRQNVANIDELQIKLKYFLTFSFFPPFCSSIQQTTLHSCS